jgi:excisionase family DNA binding protein
MSQIDHLLGRHDDSSPARIGLADASRFDTPAHPDSSKSDESTMASGTLTISQAAALLGVGRNLAYEVVARDGELAGVPVIRVGRRLLIPHARLLAVLGLDNEALLSDRDQ